jgi:hypothetical protein
MHSAFEACCQEVASRLFRNAPALSLRAKSRGHGLESAVVRVARLPLARFLVQIEKQLLGVESQSASVSLVFSSTIRFLLD